MKKLAALVLLLAPLQAAALTLDWPLACHVGEDCFVQNYVDRDPGPGMLDYTCGPQSYENSHDGTDIRLRNLAAMRAGVAVLAAAEGTVGTVRDGMTDVSIDTVPDHNTNHRDCGNAVLLHHAEGYDTLYCHLKKGSIAVAPGQKVTVGQKLAEVGLSGQTDFPHLHFSVRKNSEAVDPFDGQRQTSPCGQGGAALWQHSPSYLPAALLGDGVLDTVPDKHALRDAPKSLAQLDANAKLIAYWVDVINLRKGDVLNLRIAGPDGKPMAEHVQPIDSPRGFQFAFIGRRLHAPLAAGDYRAQVTLTRGGQKILDAGKTVTVR